MKTAALIAASLLVAAGPAAVVNFDTAEAGKAPAGWTATQTGSGHATWAVVRDDSAPSKPNVLKQSGQATYPVALKDETNLKDGFVEVKFKALSGKEDQAAGLVWRAKDANNYYVARANALEKAVAPDSPVSTDPHATLAWSGNLAPSLKTDLTWRSVLRHGGQQPFQMLFEGTGFVVVQPYKDASRIAPSVDPLEQIKSLFLA